MATLREIISSTVPHIQSLTEGPKKKIYVYTHKEKVDDVVETLDNLSNHLTQCNEKDKTDKHSFHSVQSQPLYRKNMG